MKVRRLPAIIVEIGLALFLASQVLAQAPIEGWDKAKFGMTPEELRAAYTQEVVSYLKQGVASGLDQVWTKQGIPSFWLEWGESELRQIPYSLSTGKLKVLGLEAGISFDFVHFALFEISVSAEIRNPKNIPMSQRLEVIDKFNAKLDDLRNHLIEKYGTPLNEETKEHGSQKDRIWKWEDAEGNRLTLEISSERHHHKSYEEEERHYDLSSFQVVYESKRLTDMWMTKVTRWKEERLGLYNKGVVSF